MLNDRLRLQIRTEERPAGTLSNSLVNSNGDAGNFGWTRTSGTTWDWLANEPAPKNITRTNVVTQYASSTAVAAAGNVIEADMSMTGTVHVTQDSAGNYFEKDCVETRVGIQTMNGATAVATTWTAWHVHTNTGGPLGYQDAFTHSPANVTIPASGVNGVRVVFEVRLTADGVSHGAANSAGHAISLSGTMYVNTGAPVTPAVAGTAWVDIWGQSANIETDRSELGLGTMHADIYDANLDPKTNTQMHKGAQIRLQVEAIDGVWQSMFVGNVTDINTTYSKQGNRPHISLNAVDAVAILANAPEDDGKPTLEGIANLIDTDHPTIPFAYNGTLNSPMVSWSAVASTYVHPEQSLLQSIAITRDTVGGYAWVDKSGVLQMYDAANLPTRGGQISFMDTFDANEYLLTNHVLNPNRVVSGTAWTGSGGHNYPPLGAGVLNTFSVLVTAGSKDLYAYATSNGNNNEGAPAYLHRTADINASSFTRWTIPAGTSARIAFNSSWLWRNTTTGTGTWNQAMAWKPGVFFQHVDGTAYSATGVLTKEAFVDWMPSLVQTTSQVPYFDGDSSGASWTGTPNASTSTKDPARYVSYSDIDAGFSLSDVINSIVIKRLEFDIVGETVETVVGTYNDAASILKYGTFQKEVTITGSTDAGTLAAAILAKTATPQVRVESITMPVVGERSLAKALLADLYMDVEVVKEGVYSGEVMITRLKHKITANQKYGLKWSMEAGFRPTNAVAAFVGNPPALVPSNNSTPMAGGFINSIYNLPVNGFNGITNYTQSHDTADMFDPSTGLMVIPKDGVYALSGSLFFNTNITGRRFLQIESGTGAAGSNTVLIRQELATDGYVGPCVYSETWLSAGTTVRMVAYQTSGGALTARGDFAPITFSVRQVG